MSTALVKVEKHPITNYLGPQFVLVDEQVVFDTREAVKTHLPEICGRVLARAWIDKAFYAQLEKNTLETFNSLGVHLPSDMFIEFKKGKTRASIIVYEQTGRLKVRVCSLELTMIARR